MMPCVCVRMQLPSINTDAPNQEITILVHPSWLRSLNMCARYEVLRQPMASGFMIFPR